jgi:5-methylcytosine-specific restriction endonuclease McrA
MVGMQGKKHTEASKLKMSLSHKGHYHTLESRIKISMTQSKRQGNERESFKEFQEPDNRRIRKLRQWKVWREAVFKRDNYICQKCETTTEQLHPHHLLSVKDCLDLGFKEEIFNPDNGITFCPKCHKEEDMFQKGIKRVHLNQGGQQYADI